MTTATRETPTVDTVESDAMHLHDLLDVTFQLLQEMSFERDGKRDTELDRIASLMWIARDHAERLASNIGKIIPVEKAA